MKQTIKTGLIFTLLAFIVGAWFIFLLPWDQTPDPDAFYHAAVAKMTWSNGPVTEFPWLDMTSLGSNFADQHYLLHVLQGPFVNYWGELTGLRISSVVFGLLCVLGLALAFYALRLRPFWLWILLLAFTQPFCTRMLQGKASPFAILLWFSGIAVCLWFMKSKTSALDANQDSNLSPNIDPSDPSSLSVSKCKGNKNLDTRTSIAIVSIALFIISFLFVLTHGGWIILLLSIGLLFIGRVIFDYMNGGVSFIEGFRTAPWFLLFVAVCGTCLGFIMHPGRTELLQLLWIQVVKIGIFTPHQLVMGNEWNSATVGDALGMSAIFGVILILTIAGMFMAPRKNFDKIQARTVFIIAPLVTALFVMSLKSVRYAEYLQPLLCLWIALLAQWVDWRAFIKDLSMGNGFIGKWILPSIIGFSLCVVMLNNVWSAYGSFHPKERLFTDNYWSTPLHAISEAAQPGDRVYHAQWDEFPWLILREPRLRYVSGLDPTFLYEASSTMALDYAKLSFNTVSTTREFAWNFIHDRLGAKWIIIDDIRWKKLNELIASDARYVKIAEGERGVAYKVEAPTSSSVILNSFQDQDTTQLK